jgi:hypothetical protein
MGGDFNRIDILLESDLLHRLRQLQLRDPAPVRLRPRAFTNIADLVS